jgi:clathrin heavy chain
VLNPEGKILALRKTTAEGVHLHLFHTEMQRKLKEFTLSEAVDFWKWISPSTLAIVTTSAVYHWSVEGATAPARIFARNASLRTSQIINYRTDSTQRWLLIIGIAQRDGRVAGSMQLYSVDKQQDQVMLRIVWCV